MAGTLTVDQIKTGGGIIIPRPIQIQRATFLASATGTTVTPYDNTIPQISEGDQYMTLAITPTSLSSILVIEGLIIGSHSVGGNFTWALHQDAITNAIAAWGQVIGGGFMYTLPFKHYVTAPSTSAITYRIRMGSSAAGTTTFNGIGGAGMFGGVMPSSITITEYLQ